jgi:Tfp pilus assembly protein PilX
MEKMQTIKDEAHRRKLRDTERNSTEAILPSLFELCRGQLTTLLCNKQQCSPAKANESGSVLVVALIMLVLLTVLGITATSTSNIELQIANNERNFKRAFFIANAGIEHARADLAANLAIFRATQISQASALDWSFALNNDAGKGTATEINDPDDPNNPVWFNNVSFGDGYSYTVTVFNDDDSATGGTATSDTNGRIYAQAVAAGPNGVQAVVKVLLLAAVTGQATESYSQYGGDMSKNFTGNDLNAPGSYDTAIGSKTYTSAI